MEAELSKFVASMKTSEQKIPQLEKNLKTDVDELERAVTSIREDLPDEVLNLQNLKTFVTDLIDKANL